MVGTNQTTRRRINIRHTSREVSVLEMFHLLLPKLVTYFLVCLFIIYRRRDHFVKVRYKDKRDVMSLAKKQSIKLSETDEDNRELYVLKSIMKDHIGDELVLNEMRQEIFTMSKLNHPNICRLIEAYERRRHIYLVMEFMAGGNLAGAIPMPESRAAIVCKKIFSAVEHMHCNGIAHRDIVSPDSSFEGL